MVGRIFGIPSRVGRDGFMNIFDEASSIEQMQRHLVFRIGADIEFDRSGAYIDRRYSVVDGVVTSLVRGEERERPKIVMVMERESLVINSEVVELLNHFSRHVKKDVGNVND